MFRKTAGIAVLLTIAATACTNKSATVAPPREVLGAYIGSAFAVKKIDDLSKLKEYTTGGALAELENVEADAKKEGGGEHLFKHAFEDQKIESPSSLRIRDERKIDEGHYSITYELTYQNSSEVTKDRVTVKKHAIFNFDPQSQSWRIAEVQGLKTLVEHATDENIESSKAAPKSDPANPAH